MVLVDTSIWISHFRRGNPRLKELLWHGHVVCHPFIIGELACGNFKNRTEVIALLQALPKAQVAESDEVLRLIERKQLIGAGVGLVDVHLLASALLTRVRLWTADRQLKSVSARLDVFHG